VLLEVGPVSSHAVLAWIDYAEAVLAAVADEPSGGADDESFDDYVPAEVYAQFAAYLQDWRPIAESTDVTAGDIVRHLRMAVQLMRQVRRAIDRDWDLREKLLAAMERMNRDVVDARRQLELG